MPIDKVWDLVLVLIGVVVIVVIDDFRRGLSLKNANEQVSMLREKIDMIMRENEKSISDIKEIHFNEISHLEEFKKNMTDESNKTKKKYE